MLDTLKDIGLSEKEALVYLTMIKLGKCSVEQIAKEAKVTRTNTYNQIETLQSLGLITSITEGKKKLYTAEDPENLTRILERKKEKLRVTEQQLQVTLPEITALYARKAHKPIVRFFAGKEGLLTMREEILKMKGKKLQAATDFDKFTKTLSKEERNSFTRQRKRKKITTQLLFSSSKTIPHDEYSPEEFKQVSKKEFPFEFDIYLFDNKVGISAYEDGIWSILIESEAVAKSMQTLFNLVWQSN